MIIQIVKNVIPRSYWKPVSAYVRLLRNYFIKRNIIKYYKYKENISPEIEEVIQYLIDEPLHIFPYGFTKSYTKDTIELVKDSNSGLFYTFFEGKKMFFKRSWTPEIIKEYYNFLLMEQDIQSPHRYLVDSFCIQNDDVVADIGAAEGIFSLSIIEKVQKIYMFEPDKEWVEALELTFSPWKYKVEIIEKYVKSSENTTSVSIDSFFKDKKISFFKIDVDGGEVELLKGGLDYFYTHNAKIAICTYHKQEDEKKISSFLSTYGYDINYSQGYMIFIYDKYLKEPYLRKAMIRATK